MKTVPRVILLIETSRAFGREFLYGIARYSRIHGPWVFYREAGGLEKSIPRLKDWGADGIIMRNTRKNNDLLELGLPTILVIHGQEKQFGFPRVLTDGVNISRMAGEHFFDRGYRNFAYCGFSDSPWSHQRGEQFIKVVNKAGYEIQVYPQPKSKVKRQWKYEQVIMGEWLKSLPKPVGLMAGNDDRGQQILEACKIAQLQVPDEVAVIGVDNDELVCDLSDPPLTSIALNTEKAGYEAAQLLDMMMFKKKWGKKDIMVRPSHVVTRQSTDMLALEDAEVVDAIRFIRQNAKKKIRVDDVASAAGISRRGLEKRFRKLLNRSVQQEIRRVRNSLICKMLVDTGMSIATIAQAMGFGGAEHIARYFRKEMGMSLRAYRKEYAGK